MIVEDCGVHQANIEKNNGACERSLGCSNDGRLGRAWDFVKSDESRNACENIRDVGIGGGFLGLGYDWALKQTQDK